MIENGNADIDARFFTKLSVEDPINYWDHHGKTALMCAAIENRKDHVEKLLILGANPNLQLNGQYIWNICKDENICALVKEKASSKKRIAEDSHEEKRPNKMTNSNQ